MPQRADGMIIKYPLCNVFQVAHMHGQHCNSAIADYAPGTTTE